MPRRLEHPVDRREERAELAVADRLEHLDRRDLRVAAVVLAVVLLEDRHPVGEARGRDALACQLRLLGRDRQARHPAAGLLRRVDREAAPAAADLEHVVVGAELQVRADPVELGALRLGERQLRRLEDRARVRHRLVEHQLEQLVAEVVVVGDVAPRAQQAVAAVQPRPGLEHPPQRAVALRRRLGVAQQQLEQPDEIVAVPLARRVRLAEPELAAGREPAEETGVVDPQLHRQARSRSCRRVPSGSVTSSAPPSRCSSSRSRNATATRSTSGTRARGAAAHRANRDAHARTEPSPGDERRLVVERHALQPEPQRLAVDQRGHLQRHQRIPRERPRNARIRQLAAPGVEDRGERPLRLLAHVDARPDRLPGLRERPLVALVEPEERRDVQPLRLLVLEGRAAQHLGQPLAEGVVQLGDHARRASRHRGSTSRRRRG